VSAAFALPQALPCAVFVVATMSLAGIAHAWWLRSKLSLRLGAPVDLRLTLRGRRLFGANKMWRGFAVMPPAAALAFWAAGLLRPAFPAWLYAGTWDLALSEYAELGFVCGFAFMLAELPNSFVKRQLDVAPGMASRDRALAVVFFVVDRVDSVLGVLIALTALVPVAPATWAWVLALGPAVHWLFSLWLYRLKVKARPL
jgi:CDP-2,3-bis-(O-geranylgeranyl)-sn-glycerol synthase